MKLTGLCYLALLLCTTACKKDNDESKPATGEPPKAKASEENPAVIDAAPKTAEPATKLTTEEVSYTVGGTTMKGYLAYDPAVEGPRPGVLVVHEWWGHNDYARKRAEMLAGLGYTALAVDMYGDGKTADHPEDAKKFMMEVMSNFDQAKERFIAAEKLLDDHDTTDPEKTAAIGYCMGGAIVLNMARAGLPLSAVAAFHAGSLAPAVEAKADAITKNIMVFHGAADPFVPADQVTGFQEEMKKLGIEPVFEAYEGAKHGFTNPGATEMGTKFELPLQYDESADKDSWEKMKAGLASAFQS